MSIFGWDISHYDWNRGPVNLAAAVAAGISFATHKATEGTTLTDPRYGQAAARAHGTVPLFGAYHVLHTGNVNAQVDHYLKVLATQSPWWQDGPFIIQLDCERWPADFPSPHDIDTWCDRFIQVSGGTHQPIVYASRSQYGNRLAHSRWPLWNAHYTGGNPPAGYRSLAPSNTWPGWAPYGSGPATAVIGQYGSRTIIGGQTECDANIFPGSIQQLRALTIRGRVPEAAAVGGGDFLMSLTPSQQSDIYYTLTEIPDPRAGTGTVPATARVPLHVWCAFTTAAIKALADHTGLPLAAVHDTTAATLTPEALTVAAEGVAAGITSRLPGSFSPDQTATVHAAVVGFLTGQP